MGKSKPPFAHVNKTITAGVLFESLLPLAWQSTCCFSHIATATAMPYLVCFGLSAKCPGLANAFSHLDLFAKEIKRSGGDFLVLYDDFYIPAIY